MSDTTVKTLVYKNAKGEQTPAQLHLGMYQDAAAAGLTLSQHLANVYPTNSEKYGSAYEQFKEQLGIFVSGDKDIGLRPSTVHDVVNPSDKSASITREGIPTSRLLFPAVVLDVIEDKLIRDRSRAKRAFDELVAIDDSIQGDRYERPVINCSRPEQARSGPVGQLSLPPIMLSITASDTSNRVPSWGIGLEISEQAMKNTTLDLVGIAVARQSAVESEERHQGYMISLLNGETDVGMAALSSISGKVKTAQSFDATITTAGKITYKAWLKWLMLNNKYRTITHVVTDLDGILALRDMYAAERIESGKKDTPAGMDIAVSIVNPNWPSNVKFVVTEDPNWPANTYMGVDREYGIHRIRSLSAQYAAIESFALKRSTALRVDAGEMIYRLYDEAFEVLSLTV